MKNAPPARKAFLGLLGGITDLGAAVGLKLGGTMFAPVRNKAGLGTVRAFVSGGAALDGEVQSVTFLGSTVIYQVALDWMTIEVSTENQPGLVRRAVGDAVTLWWHDDAIAVVPG